MNISQEEHSQQLQIPGNANRMYTAEEDQEILDHWWDRSARPDLCRRLGRTKAALAQRFYAIIKEKGISPEEYRRQMRARAQAQAQAAQGTVPSKSEERKGQETPWTREGEMRLWRLTRAGMSLEEISAELGRSVPDCMAKLAELKRENEAYLKVQSEGPEELFFTDPQAAEPMGIVEVPVAEREKVPATGQAEPVEVGAEERSMEEHSTDAAALGLQEELDDSQENDTFTEDSDSDEDIFEALKRFPRQLRRLTSRMDQLELDYQMLREKMEFVLEELGTGIQRTGGIISEHKAEFTTFQKLKEENHRLREQLGELEEQMEREKQELRKTYQEVDFWLGEFLKLRKIEKVASLSDFIPKLKYSYDRFGVLLNIARD
ncbi:MAG: DUF342 domain-containing protein [Firmicutes bacterium]|nr:DUF342 domain-containing protein [Bacillota bacterium]